MVKITSYSITLNQIGNYQALLNDMVKDASAENSPGAVLFSLFSIEGRQSIARLASGLGNDRDQEVFNFELNSLVLDKKPIALHVYELLKNSSLKSFQEFAVSIHSSTLQIEPPPFMHWLENKLRNISTYMPEEGSRYLIVTNIYSQLMQSYFSTYPDNVFSVIVLIGFVYAALMTCLFLVAHELTKSVFWSIFAVLIYQGSPATIKASFNLFSMPYLFVPFVMIFAIYAYIRYKTNGDMRWLALCIIFSFLSPWVREFGGAVPFIIFGAEILRYQGRRSALVMWLCVPLMIHGFFPSLLMFLLGLYKGQIHTHFASTHVQTFVNQVQWPLWHMYAMLFSQIPPMLWIILTVSIIVWLKRFWALNTESKFEIPFWGWRIPLPLLPAKARLFLEYFLPLAVVGIIPAFGYSFFVLNQEAANERVFWGVALFLIIPLVVLPSFRFNAILPVYFLAMAIPFIRVVLGDVHFSFTLPPLAILFALWARDLWKTLETISTQGKRSAAQITFMCFMGIGLADQLMNIPASAIVQRELLAGNMRMAEWIKSHLPKHSIVIGNAFNFSDVSYYAKSYSPYGSNGNYGPPVIASNEELLKLLKNNQGIRDVYFLASDHPYYIYQVDFHSNQFVRKPPGNIIKLAEFNVNKVYSYIDPIKYFVPRFFIPQAGYQDWETDFYFNNLDVPFRRIYFADYAIFKLVV